MPGVTPLYYHYPNWPSICNAFDYTHVPHISDTLHIIRRLFKPQFIHYTKYEKYAFLLLFSIHCKYMYFTPDCIYVFYSGLQTHFKKLGRYAVFYKTES